jgi:hypothetical protein
VSCYLTNICTPSSLPHTLGALLPTDTHTKRLAEHIPQATTTKMTKVPDWIIFQNLGKFVDISYMFCFSCAVFDKEERLMYCIHIR